MFGSSIRRWSGRCTGPLLPCSLPACWTRLFQMIGSVEAMPTSAASSNPATPAWTPVAIARSAVRDSCQCIVIRTARCIGYSFNFLGVFEEATWLKTIAKSLKLKQKVEKHRRRTKVKRFKAAYAHDVKQPTKAPVSSFQQLLAVLSTAKHAVSLMDSSQRRQNKLALFFGWRSCSNLSYCRFT